MKFKRILATVLGGMMIMSSFSFVANAEVEAVKESTKIVATQNGDLQSESQIKNIIFMIPDGGGDTLMDLANLVKKAGGIDKSKYPNSTVTDNSAMSVLSYLAGFCTTSYADPRYITDSAAAGTALATGYKTYIGRIGLNAQDKPVANVLEAAQATGKATGIVATAEWMHATPAAFTAHSEDRDDYEELYKQIQNKELDVVLGAGYGKVEKYGDTIQTAIDAGYSIIKTKSDASNVKPGDKLWGNIADTLPRDTELKSTQPTLAELTEAAITALSGDEDGFFLMVEGSKVDNGGHNNDAFFATGEYLAFDAAWKVAVEFAKGRNDTVVIGAPDHDTGGLNLKEDMTTEIAQIRVGTTPTTFSWTSGDHTKRNVPVWIYTPEGVDTIEGLNPVVGDSEASRNDYVIDNTAFAPYVAGLMGVDLDELTEELFVDVTTIGSYMPTSRRFVFNNTTDGEKYIYENADTYYLAGTPVDMHGKVSVYINGKFYVPAEMVDEADWEYTNPENPDIIEGSGTEGNPYLINSAKDYLEFVTGLMNGSDYSGTYYKQIEDIDIANNPDFLGITADYTFAGVYDGNGHTINVGYSSVSAGSLFPTLSGDILNLGVTGSITSTSADMVGGIAAKVIEGGKIINCYSKVNYDGKSFGGITTTNKGAIVNSYFAGSVENATTIYPIANARNTDGIVNCYYVYNEDYNNFTKGAIYVTEAEAKTKLAYYLEGGIESAKEAYGYELSSWEQKEESYPSFVVVMPFVTGVRLYPSAKTIGRGEKFQFTAMVDGIDDYSWGVHWVVEPASDFEGTYINERGVLFIDENETRESFTVQAKSKANGGVAAAATVTVGEADDYVYPRGSGTKADPYLISSERDFHEFTNAANSGTDYLGVYFKQTVDIDMDGYEGYTGMNDVNEVHFRGYYDGAGHTINVNITNTTGSSGVFGRVDRGYIINLGTTGSISTNGRAAGIVLYGHNCGTNDYNARIVNCWSSVDVTGTGNTGGIVCEIIGNGIGVLSNCYFTGTVSGVEGKVGIIATNGGGKNTRISNTYFVNDNYSSDTGYTKLSTDEEISSAHLMLNATRADAATRAGIDVNDLAIWVSTGEGMPVQVVPVGGDDIRVTEFNITPEEVDINKGASRQFALSCDEYQLANSDVNWSIVTSGTKSATAIDDKGYLTIASDETIGSITIKATLKGNADVFATATINVLDIPEAMKESETIAKYKANGYEIVYVSTTGSGDLGGSGAENARKGLTDAIKAKSGTGKKVVFVLIDTFTWSGWGNHSVKGGTVVITSIDGKNGDAQYHITSGGPSLRESVDTTKEGVVLTETDAHVIFDDITIVNGATDTDEPSIFARGSDVTLTKNVIVDTQNGKTLTIRANADSRSDIYGNTITIETSSPINIQACGYSSKISKITGDVVYNIGESANIKEFLISGKGSSNNTITGNVYVNITGNATVENINLSGASSKIDGNLYINVEDTAKVTGSGIALTSGTLTGNAVITISGGAVAGVDNTKVGGKTVVVIDETNASVTGTVKAGYIVKYNGGLGTVTATSDCAKLNIVPGANVKYIRVTNGENVKEYNAAGNEVSLLADGFTVNLAEGATTVEFLTDGTEDTTSPVTVTYVDATGNGASAAQTVQRGTITLKSAPTASGYKFMGWSDGTTTYQAGATYNITVNTTFTALWEAMLFSGGSGTKADPYIIATSADFKKLTDDMLANEAHTGKYFNQTANIDMVGVEGYNGVGDQKYFEGYYNGLGHTINVDIKVVNNSINGIFPRISSGAYIINLGTTGTVEAKGKAAGIALYIHTTGSGGKIVNCWSSVTVIGTSPTGKNVGGITGMIDDNATNAVLANCYFVGTITSTSGTSGIMAGVSETKDKVAPRIKNNYFVGNDSYTAVDGRYNRLSGNAITEAYKTLNANIQNNDYGIDKSLLMEWSSTSANGAGFKTAAVETYSVTYVNEKGAAPETVTGLTQGASYTVASAPEAVSGFTFKGWSDGTTTYNAGATITITGNVTLTAVWNEIEIVKYTVTYVNDKGTAPETVTGLTQGASYTVASAPEAVSGFTFKGWSDGTTTHNAGATITITGNVTLTAVWDNMLFGGGSGTLDDPYIIASEADFKKLTDDVNGGTTHTGIYFKQTANINMAGYTGYNGMDEGQYFQGYYDGNGHTINVNIDTTGSSGIFPRVAEGAYIINLGTTGTVKTTGRAAGIALYLHSAGNDASIVNCWSTVNVISTNGSNVGGITGQINTSATLAKIANCYFAGTITSAGGSGIMSGNETANAIVNTIKPFKNNYFINNDSYTEVAGAYERLSGDAITEAYKTLNANIENNDYGIDKSLLKTWASTSANGATFGTPLAETYTVTYVNDKGTAPETVTGLAQGASYTVASAPAEVSGFTFGGWSDGTTTYNAGATITITGNVTLTAVWNEIEIVKYTVTYVNGKGNAPDAVTDLDAGATHVVADDLEDVDGFKFVGWHNGSEILEAGSTIEITDNVTITAVWEANHIADYREDYDVVYVTNGTAKGKGDGSTELDAYAGLREAIKNLAAKGNKVVFALVDTFSWSDWTGFDLKGGDVVITAVDSNAKFEIASDDVLLGRTDVDANVTFDNIIIDNKATTRETAIYAGGNNLTLTDSVVIKNASEAYGVLIGGSFNAVAESNGVKLVIETPSKVNLTAYSSGGSTGNYIKGDVEYIIGKNANITNLYAGGKGNKETRYVSGDVTVTIKDNAKVERIVSGEQGYIKQNFYINVMGDATVDSINISDAGYVDGNVIVNIADGTVSEIVNTEGNFRIKGNVYVFADTDNAVFADESGYADYTVKYNGSLGTVTLNNSGKALLTPKAGAKFVTVTNGEDITSYSFATGKEVELLSVDAIEILLEKGATEVEFLEDGIVKDAYYKTYGEYNAEEETYTLKLMFGGASVNKGSFGFKFPAEYMTLVDVSDNVEAGVVLFGETGTLVSPVFARGEGYYANTWTAEAAPNGSVDARAEEVLIATFTFEMTADQRSEFVYELYDNYIFEEYVIENVADKEGVNKYYDGTRYLVDYDSDSLSIIRGPVEYRDHIEVNLEAPKIVYNTYGTYNKADKTYEIQIKVKGGKIGFGAFGLAFDEDYMTFDATAENAFVLADGISNFLGIELSANDGFAFVYDGSEQTNSYIDATSDEVHIATITLSMTKEQREAFEAAGKVMEICKPVATGEVSETELAKYFDGENYIVTVYEDSLDVYQSVTEYASHSDEVYDVEEETKADVTVKVDLIDGKGATLEANRTRLTIAGIEEYNGKAIEVAGNISDIEYVIPELNIGQTYTMTVEKNGYLSATAEIQVVDGENVIKITLIPGDIKGSEEAFCGDGKVDLADFVRIVRGFEVPEEYAIYKTYVDIDEDGYVTVDDLAFVKFNYGATK